MPTQPREAVGKRFDPTLMQHARERTWAALHGIRERMRPGISEDEAKLEAAEVFRALGVERLWHPPLIRIGANTTKTYRQRSDPHVRLGQNDSYFIDLGLVFEGHEGDVGDSFVIGQAPERLACAQAARTLFDEVAHAWRTRHLSKRRLLSTPVAERSAAPDLRALFKARPRIRGGAAIRDLREASIFGAALPRRGQESPAPFRAVCVPTLKSRPRNSE